MLAENDWRELTYRGVDVLRQDPRIRRTVESEYSSSKGLLGRTGDGRKSRRGAGTSKAAWTYQFDRWHRLGATGMVCDASYASRDAAASGSTAQAFHARRPQETG